MPKAQLDQYQPLHSQKQSNYSTVTVVTTQPAVSHANYQFKPDSYLGLSLFSCLCCCWIFGIIALLHSCQVDAKWLAGDYDGSLRSSYKAKRWSIVTVITGIILGISFVVITGVSAGIIAAVSHGNDCTSGNVSNATINAINATINATINDSNDTRYC